MPEGLEPMSAQQTDTPKTRRRRRSRQETETDLLDAALRLLARDGVLAGLNLREVAKEAGVNHGQIYQYFGTRQSLLRTAIARLLHKGWLGRDRYWDQPFTSRRRSMWRWALRQRDMIKLEALLALDEDPDLTLFPALERTRDALNRDKTTGALPADADGPVAHAMTAATYLGYCIFREAMARDLGISPKDLDERAADVYDLMLAGIASGAAAKESGDL